MVPPITTEHILLSTIVGFGLILVSAVVKLSSTTKKLEEQTSLLAKNTELLIKLSEEVAALKVQLNMLLDLSQHSTSATSESIKELTVLHRHMKEAIDQINSNLRELLQRELELREDNTNLRRNLVETLELIMSLKETLDETLAKYVSQKHRNDTSN